MAVDGKISNDPVATTLDDVFVPLIQSSDGGTTYTNKKAAGTVFRTNPDDEFSVVDNVDTTKKLAFQISSITTATTRTATWPDADLTVVGTATTQTLTNKSLVDVSTSFIDDADATKVMQFQLSGLTTATTRTVTWPDADLTVVGTGTTQTLTNKSLVDASTSFVDDVDATKVMQFQLSSITTGTTRTVTWPDTNVTFGTTGLALLADELPADARNELDTAPYVADYTALRALDTTKDTVAFVTASGRQGWFKWDGTDLSGTILGSAISSSAVDSATDTITSTAHGLITGDAVITTTAVNGLSLQTIYYVIRTDADNFKLASTFANAHDGTAFDLTATSAVTVKQHFDHKQARYVTPSADITGASGAWVRIPQYGRADPFEISASAFDAQGDSDGTTGNGTDDTESMQAFFRHCGIFGVKGVVSSGKYRCTDTLYVPRNVQIEFACWSLSRVSTESGGGSVGILGEGAYLYLDHTGIGVDFWNAGDLTDRRLQGRIENIATFRNQPTPAASWAPTAHDYDLYFGADATSSPGDMYLSNPFLWNATKGVFMGRRSGAASGAVGRIFIDRISGQCFQIGVYVERATDVVNIGATHFWTHWSLDSNVQSYMLQNLKALRILRADKLHVGHLFAIWTYATVALDAAASGGDTANSVYIERVSSDSSFRGLFIEGSAGVVTVGHMRHGGASASGTTDHGEEAVLVTGSDNQIVVNAAEFLRAKNGMVRTATGTGNHLALNNLLVSGWNEAASSSAAFINGSGNTIDIGGKLKFGGATGTTRYSGSGTTNRVGAETMTGSSSSTVAAGATTYLGVGGHGAINERNGIVSKAGKATRFFVRTSNTPGSGNTFTYTVVKNGVDTTMTGTISDAGTTLDTSSNEFSVARGDRLTVKLVTSASASAVHHAWGLSVDPD